MQAMGSVRLQVTGNPPTISVSSRSSERRPLRSAFQLTLSDAWSALIPTVQAAAPRKMRRESFMPDNLRAFAQRVKPESPGRRATN